MIIDVINNKKNQLIFWSNFLYIKLKSLFRVNKNLHKNKAARIKNQSIVILPHEGLGDLVALINALNAIAVDHQHIYLACRNSLYQQIRYNFYLAENVKLIRFFNKNSYKVRKSKLRVLTRHGKLIKLGLYGNNEIVDYPNSFYVELGVNPDLASQTLDFKKYSFDSVLPYLKSPYDYFNLSTGNIGFLGREVKPQRNAILYKSPTQVEFFNARLGSREVINIDSLNTLGFNIFIASSANSVVLSDAGFYNVFIRICSSYSLTIFTRCHTHTHNRKIYPQPFDGCIYKVLYQNQNFSYSKCESI